MDSLDDLLPTLHLYPKSHPQHTPSEHKHSQSSPGSHGLTSNLTDINNHANTSPSVNRVNMFRRRRGSGEMAVDTHYLSTSRSHHSASPPAPYELKDGEEYSYYDTYGAEVGQ